MTIQKAIQGKWDALQQESHELWVHLQSMLSDPRPECDGELFRKSFGLVWRYFRSLISKDSEKSTLLLFAPPYRRLELLECVLRLLISEEWQPADFLTAEEIQNAWQQRTQVMVCLKNVGSKKVKRFAYTPREDDIDEGRYWYHCGRGNGRMSFDLNKAIMLKPEARVENERPLNQWVCCTRGDDEKLFGDRGCIRLKRAVVIVGNKCDEVVSLLKKLTVGGRNLWDTFSAVVLAKDGTCARSAIGNGTPSIIVANDYGRLGPYFESTDGRYDKFHCVIYDDNEQIKENGTDGMTDQVVIRSSESIIRDLSDDPGVFKDLYRRHVENGCVFVWDRQLEEDLRGEGDNSEKKVIIVLRERHTEIWDGLPARIGILRKKIGFRENEDAFSTICGVYRQLHLPKFDVQECMDALQSCETNDQDVCGVVNDLKCLVGDYPDGETEKMVALKRFLDQVVRPDWPVRALSRTEDISLTSLIRYGQNRRIPCNVQRVLAPSDLPARTIAYRKMSALAANRHWLFDAPKSELYWFLYKSEIDALNGGIEFLDDLQTRHVASRAYRAQVLGIPEELLFEYQPVSPVVDDAQDLLCAAGQVNVSGEGDSSLQDSIARFLRRDFSARVRDNKREFASKDIGCVRIRFTDNTRSNYTRAKVLALVNGRRTEVDASNLTPGQRVFVIRPEMARLRAERLYGSPVASAERWRSVLRREMDKVVNLDYLTSRICDEAKRLGLCKEITQQDLRRYGARNDNATELPYNSVSKAAILFQAIGIIGKDTELADEQYARGLAGVIQDAHSKNRTKGRGYMDALRKDWLAGNDAIADCFSENTVAETYLIDVDDILTEE